MLRLSKAAVKDVEGYPSRSFAFGADRCGFRDADLEGVPLPEGLKQSVVGEGARGRIESAFVDRGLGEILGEIIDDLRLGDPGNVDATALGHANPLLQEGFVRDPGALNYNVEVGVPRSGATGNFNDESATGYVCLPEGGSAEQLETPDEEGYHIGQVLPVADGEGEVLEVVAGEEGDLCDQHDQPLADPLQPGEAADGTEPVSAVDRDVDSITAMSANEASVLMFRWHRFSYSRGVTSKQDLRATLVKGSFGCRLGWMRAYTSLQTSL